MNQAYIINGVRTAIGNFGGTLSVVRTDDLATIVLKELMKKNPSLTLTEMIQRVDAKQFLTDSGYRPPRK